MAAAMNTKAAFSVRSVAPKARRVVRVEASSQGVEKMLLSAAALATAAVLASPADAGVILTQPKLKKMVSDEAPFERTETGALKIAQAPAQAPAPKVQQSVASSESSLFDARTIALPGSLAFVAGLAVAASAIDKDFESFLTRTVLKDSSEEGVGYEEAIKSTAGGIYGEVTGTKKVKKGRK